MVSKGNKSKFKDFKDKCKPLIVMTIKTFFFYYDLFQKNGFKFYFDKFINKHIYYKDNSSFYYMDEFNDFDTWMRMNYTSHRDLYYKKKFEEIIEWKSNIKRIRVSDTPYSLIFYILFIEIIGLNLCA